MNKEQVRGIARHIFGYVGVYVVAKGWINSEQWGLFQDLLIAVVLGIPIFDSVNTKKTECIIINKGFFLSERSVNNLKGVDERLIKIVERGIINSPHDFTVVEGLRSAERQKELRLQGKSWVNRSKHQDGLAVDLYIFEDNKICQDYNKYKDIYEHLSKIALEIGIEINWGGNWKQRDLVHFEIN